MKITVLMENTAQRCDMAAEHGLSLLIRTKAHTILFDMGQSDAFAHNAQGVFLEIVQVVTAENVKDSPVRVQQLLSLISPVDKEAAGHKLSKLLDNGKDLLDHQLLVRLPDGQDGDRDRNIPGKRIDPDAAGK